MYIVSDKVICRGCMSVDANKDWNIRNVIVHFFVNLTLS